MGHRHTVWITIGVDGRLIWPDGQLIVPKGFDGKVDGYPEGTVVEVEGSYTRVDAHTKTLEIVRLRVTETALDRAAESWRRLSFSDDPKSSPTWPSFVDALHAVRGEASPTALLLRAWRSWIEDDRDEAVRTFGEALTLDTLGAEALVRTLWKLTYDDVRETLSNRQREELARGVWRSPAGWDWVHPFVESVWSRERPPHFGGPRPNADESALRTWLGRKMLDIATPEEKTQIVQISTLSKQKRRALVSRLRAEDQARYDEAYADMVHAWSANPDNDMDSPPDDVGVTWVEESRRLPVRWCGLMSGSESWEDKLGSVARWLVGFWRERWRDVDAFVHLMDAACIVSSLDPSLVDRLDEVVFAHAGLTEGWALVLLNDGEACVLEAPDGPFGVWSHRLGEPSELVDDLPDAELARLALKRRVFAWSPRSYRIDSYGHEVAEREGTLPKRSKKPKVEPEKPRWVVHKRHGRGLVVGSIPGPKGPKLVIEFETAGRKTLLHSFVEDE